MAARRITALCKRNVIYIRQVRVKYLELTPGYMGKFFNNGSMTMKFHNLNGQAGLGIRRNAKDEMCVKKSRNLQILVDIKKKNKVLYFIFSLSIRELKK